MSLAAKCAFDYISRVYGWMRVVSRVMLGTGYSCLIFIFYSLNHVNSEFEVLFCAPYRRHRYAQDKLPWSGLQCSL